MIILDTNVLSALMQATPDVRVVAWLDRQAPESIWTTSITLFESRLGLALLPEGRRRQALEASFEQLLNEDLQNRVFVFDTAAALEAAALAATRRRAGRPVDLRDTQDVSAKPWKYLLAPHDEIAESKRLSDFLRFEVKAS